MRSVRWILACFVVLIGSVAQAQVFWSVTDDDGNRNWLIGTVHSDDPRLLEFPEALIEALQEADWLALELVPDGSMLDDLKQAMHFENGRLDEVIDGDLYCQVVGIMEESYGMGEPAVRRMRPWAVAMTLSVPPPETGLFMDLALSFRADALGVDVIALETMDEQLDFLGGLSQSEQIQLIREAVEDHDELPELFEELVEAYLSGDLDRLEALSNEHMADLDQDIVNHFMEVGLAERNLKMLDRASEYLEEGGLIIAVGALHLPGEEGMIKLLRQSGYKVEGIY